MEKEGLVPRSDEIVLAIVQPTGTDLATTKTRFEEASKKVGADFSHINLTDFLDDISDRILQETKFKNALDILVNKESEKTSEFKTLSKKMHMGTLLREHYQKDIFSIYGLCRILSERRVKNSNKRVVLLDSLKHPDEVRLLRETYGSAFFLIAVNAPKQRRIQNLKLRKNMTELEATELVSRDEDEGVKHGQKMGKVFDQADFFITDTSPNQEIDRFIELIFGNVKIAPSKHEFFMHQAGGAAAFSSDLSRQVGAVLVSPSGELLSVGANEVPKYGGGQYATGELPDARDVVVGHDPNHRRREELLAANTEVAKKIKISNLTEFHRAVHAEMEAILACARKGQSPVNARLYCTTYPCHNCAKHLIGSGIKEIFFIEAYPKSLALDLHGDALIFDEQIESSTDKMVLKRFYGVGPRRFLDLFSQNMSGGLSISRKMDEGDEPWNAISFGPSVAKSRFPMLITHSETVETISLDWLIVKNNMLKDETADKYKDLLKAS